MLNDINLALFHVMHGAQPGWRLLLGELAAEWLIMLIPVTLTLLWMSGNGGLRLQALRALLATAAALAVNGMAGHLWFHPRPFMAGLADNLLHHAPDSSFPSDHATIMFTVALVLLAARDTRHFGVLIGLAGLATAWARVYLGVHWPLDMVGALLVAGAVTGLTGSRRGAAVAAALLGQMIPTYRRVLALPIRRGWLRP